MLSTAEALAKLLNLAPLPEGESVPLAKADSRILLRDVVAGRDQPPFAASAMDGYAVRASEAVEGARLTVVDEAAAGHRADLALPPGAAIRIFTGAPVPDGSDTILIQENTGRCGNQITVTEAPPLGDYIRPAGGDFASDFTLTAPRRLSPREVALLAAMNCAEVRVARRPVVALIPTGDELVLPGQNPGPDQIVSSNNYGLAAMLARAGALPRLCPIARDSRESLLAALDAAEGADIVVTLGGASVGDHDLVADVLGEAGLTLDFYKVAMRPGKPLMAGRIHDKMMIGLPGNPVSAMVCGEIFLRPVIERMLGLPVRGPHLRQAKLARPITRNGPREHYMRAVVMPTETGFPVVEIFENQDSSRLATLAQANALVVRAPDAPALDEENTVLYMSLD
ncbi:MAG: gephyrin-like molybdotransferase Glp [Pseudomonadota bacterium]